VLRGCHTAKIDDKARLKLPTAFRALIEEQHGSGLFLTSLTGDCVRLYPMPVWLALEARIARLPSAHPSRSRFLDRVNFYGQADAFDAQGRVTISPRLREAAGISGDVDVIGHVDYLEVWNHDRFVAKLERDPYTDDDARALSEHGV
jgi:MraZ protein